MSWRPRRSPRPSSPSVAPSFDGMEVLQTETVRISPLFSKYIRIGAFSRVGNPSVGFLQLRPSPPLFESPPSLRGLRWHWFSHDYFQIQVWTSFYFFLRECPPLSFCRGDLDSIPFALRFPSMLPCGLLPIYPGFDFQSVKPAGNCHFLNASKPASVPRLLAGCRKQIAPPFRTRIAQRGGLSQMNFSVTLFDPFSFPLAPDLQRRFLPLLFNRTPRR